MNRKILKVYKLFRTILNGMVLETYLGVEQC